MNRCGLAMLGIDAGAGLARVIGIVRLPWGSRGQIALSAYIHQPQRVWTLLTAWAVPGHLLPVTGSLVLLSIGVLLERLPGATPAGGRTAPHPPANKKPADCRESVCMCASKSPSPSLAGQSVIVNQAVLLAPV